VDPIEGFGDSRVRHACVCGSLEGTLAVRSVTSCFPEIKSRAEEDEDNRERERWGVRGKNV
jgi:hypothetical protein